MSLKLRGYGVAFGSRVVLAEINADIGLEHELEVLMGPVGVGKSTLLRSLAGLHDRNPEFKAWGVAEMDGQPISARHKPVLITQKGRLLSGTVLQAIESAVRERQDGRSLSAREWKDWACSEVEYWQASALLPGPALDKPVLDLPELSQRIVFILAHLALRPSWLFVDEPTSGLEEREAERLVDWLQRIAAQMRMLVCLHHQGQASRIADKVLLLGGGRVLAHESRASFFGMSTNPWVQEFRRTGSLAIPSPDAQAEDLAEGVPLPPPLPEAARLAIASFKKQAERGLINASESRQPASNIFTVPPTAAPQGITQAPVVPKAASSATSPDKSSEPSSRDVTDTLVGAVKRPSTASMDPPFTGRLLPRLSDQGVELGALVGNVLASDHMGPEGFRWIVPGQLAGCAEPGVVAPIQYDLELLRNVGVSWLLTLTENDLDAEALARAGLRNLHLPIIDREAPTIRQGYMLAYRLQKLLDQGEVVAVHCKAGLGRTGTVLAAWLIREGGLTAKEAMDRLRRIHPAYVQSEQQEAFLYAFENDILLRS